jgi:hypothetical protein
MLHAWEKQKLHKHSCWGPSCREQLEAALDSANSWIILQRFLSYTGLTFHAR